jgi:hypothetical protein
MILQVRFSDESFPALIAVVWQRVFVEFLVESQQPLHFEVFFAVAAFKRSIIAVSHKVAVEVLLRLEAFTATLEGAVEVQLVAVGCLMSLHVGLLDEAFAAKAAFMRSFASVQLHVSVEAELLREILLTDLADMALFAAISKKTLTGLVIDDGLAENQVSDQEVLWFSSFLSVLL